MHRALRVVTMSAAISVAGLLAVTGPAGAHGDGHGHHRHRHHHHWPTLTAEQKTCLADHGFPLDGPRPDLRDPAVRAALFAALRDCGIIPSPPSTSTTSTSTTTSPTEPPPVVANLHSARVTAASTGRGDWHPNRAAGAWSGRGDRHR